MFVIKKDGTKQAYNFKKIETAINKSAERIGIELSTKEFEAIEETLGNLIVGRQTIEVYVLHQLVEKTLDLVSPLVARSYRDYRNYKMEYGFQLINEFENKVIETLESVDRENSNSNTRYISTKRTDIAQNFSKEMYQKMFLSVYVLQAIRDGYIYIHDLKDMLLPQYNCCLTDVKTILNGGFELENVWYCEPKDITTAVGQVGDIIMVISAQHYGGNTTPQIDKILAPYYKKTIEMYFNRYVERGMNEDEAFDYAKIDAYRDMKQALQGLEAKLNTVVSARGSYPFTTFTFGSVENIHEADVAKAVLEVRVEGHGLPGKKKTMIFPKLVFLHDEAIHDEGKEFDWLFDLAVKCTSKCMYPDYIGKSHRREGKWVSPMGCRAYLSNYRDPETNELVFDGRFNIGAVSLNLPMIYKKAKDEQLDFYEVLEHYLQMIRKIHVNRYEYLSKAKASSNPLMFCQGGAYGGNLKPDDRIAPLLKHATASFGITALNELQILHNGKRLAEDQKFANEVMDYINERVDAFKEEDGNLYAIYNTPAESLCGTQVNQFRNKYGIIEGVSDKDYFTNSNHMWVGEHLTPFEKQDKEIELFKKSSGGHIGYVRINNPGNLTALKAVIERGLELGFYQGVNFNACHCEKCGHHGNDFGEECPVCGSKEIDEQNRTCGYLGFSRRRGDHTFNAAKMAEIKQRVSM